jgi:hypothetical protein
MKLRSGKIVKQPLPKVLEKKLNEDLADFKALLANNEEFAKELIKIIAIAPSIDRRIQISDKIDKAFQNVPVEGRHNIVDLQEISMSLLMITTGEDEIYRDNNINFDLFHDLIEEKVLNDFNIEVVGQDL